MAFCKHCGSKLEDGAKFCPECGTEIEDNGAKFCAKCGNERKGTEKFCSQCGTPFGQSLIVNDKEIKGQGKSAKKGVVIASIVAVIALGGAAWYFLGNQQDKYSLEGLAKAAVNYDAVGDFHDGLAQVSKGEKIGFIDKMGNEVIPCIYDFMEETDCSFHEGLAFVRQGDNCYFINKEGKKAFDFKYDAANHFSEGLAIVWKDGKTGYIDTKGNEVIALSDKYAYYDFSEGLAAVGKDGKYGFIDKSGNLVIPINYDDIGEMDSEPYFHEGLSAVCKNEKYGYIDKSGKEVIPFKYTYAHDFSEGLAVVKQNDKWGFIDKNGSIVIPCVFDEPAVFSEGYAAVSKDGKYYIIDKNGKEVFSLSAYTTGYGDAIFHEGFAPVFRKIEDSHVCGFVDTSGKEVIPCVYTNWPSFSEGLAVVEKDGVYGFVDKKGNSTFDIENEDIRKALQTRIQKEKMKRMHEEEKEQREINRQFIESTPYTSTDNDVSTYNSNVDVRPILLECQNEITTCQREIESLCRTFGTLASNNDIDMMKYGQMKMTFINGVNGWLNKANKAFDKCSRDLQQAGVNNAVSAVNQEKHQFNRAINELKSKTLQQVEMSY